LAVRKIGEKIYMPSVQYIIDSICASVTVECVYQMIEALMSEGSCTVADILPLIQTKDRSLDLGSAKMIAKAALDDMAQRGIIRIEDENIYPAKQLI
jgi:hypothetical protein